MKSNFKLRSGRPQSCCPLLERATGAPCLGLCWQIASQMFFPVDALFNVWGAPISKPPNFWSQLTSLPLHPLHPTKWRHRDSMRRAGGIFAMVFAWPLAAWAAQQAAKAAAVSVLVGSHGSCPSLLKKISGLCLCEVVLCSHSFLFSILCIVSCLFSFLVLLSCTFAVLACPASEPSTMKCLSLGQVVTWISPLDKTCCLCWYPCDCFSAMN